MRVNPDQANAHSQVILRLRSLGMVTSSAEEIANRLTSDREGYWLLLHRPGGSHGNAWNLAGNFVTPCEPWNTLLRNIGVE